MKKDLILIGNKPNIKNISDIVDSYDYVLRVNRMQNYGLSGYRIDGLYICIWHQYLDLLTSEQHEITLKAKRIYTEPRNVPYFKMHWQQICTEEQYRNHGLFRFLNIGFDRIIPNRLPNQCPTSTFKLLDYLLTTPEWMDNYNITITGIDVEGRSDLLNNCKEWNETTHKTVGEAEANFVLNNIKLGNIKYLSA